MSDWKGKEGVICPLLKSLPAAASRFRRLSRERVYFFTVPSERIVISVLLLSLLPAGVKLSATGVVSP